MKPNVLLTFLAMFSILLSSCEAVAGIFKTGMWFGIILVVGIIVLILYFVGKSKK